jgi:hypothetical protein
MGIPDRAATPELVDQIVWLPELVDMAEGATHSTRRDSVHYPA